MTKLTIMSNVVTKEILPQPIAITEFSANETLAPRINLLIDDIEFRRSLVALAPVTWVTWALVAVNVLIWLAMAVYGVGGITTSTATLLALGANSASEVQRGEIWRLFTAMFLHGGLMHLAMNMVGLVVVGQMVERIYGHRLLALIYLGAGLVGGAFSLHFSAQQGVSVGASGAIFGIAGALIVAVYRHRKTLPKIFVQNTSINMALFVGISLVQGFAMTGIDNAAHVGGLISGIVLAWMLTERFNAVHFKKTLNKRTLYALVFVAVATFGVAASTPTAPFSQSESIQAADALVRGMEQFSENAKAIQQDGKDLEAGKLTEQEVDDRSRTVHAPALAKTLEVLRSANFSPNDPRAEMASTFTKMVSLVHEIAAMDSIFINGKPVPADAKRSAQIHKELQAINERVPLIIKTLRDKKK